MLYADVYVYLGRTMRFYALSLSMQEAIKMTAVAVLIAITGLFLLRMVQGEPRKGASACCTLQQSISCYWLAQLLPAIIR